MKKFISEHTELAIIIVSLLIVTLLVVTILLFTKHDSNKKLINNYTIKDKATELPGTKAVSSDELQAEQCLDNICVSDVIIYSTSNAGRIECTITNKNQERRSGYLKVKINDKELIVSYVELTAGGTTKSIAQFSGFSLQDASDYSIEALTKDEKKAVVSK